MLINNVGIIIIFSYLLLGVATIILTTTATVIAILEDKKSLDCQILKFHFQKKERHDTATIKLSKLFMLLLCYQIEW